MNILTFDIEEWFHILDTGVSRSVTVWDSFESRIHENVDRILGVLATRKSQRATFFCLGWIARKYPDIIWKIHAEGYEIGSHTSMHQLVYELGATRFKTDVEDSMRRIEDITGKKVAIFRAPGFSMGKNTPWAFECLARLGIEFDCSVFPAAHGHGGFPEFGLAQPSIITCHGISIKEFPINVVTVLGKKLIFSGGGYFRLVPYPLLSRLFKRSSYTMTYFHPRDFDASQKVIDGLSLARRFKSYYGLRSAFSKFERLLDEFTFTDVRGAAAGIDWTKTPVVKI
jgi:polysaccharide deacetylase family protein (PEP-CTERM system associated)